MVVVRRASIDDIVPWAVLRADLWSSRTADGHRDDLIQTFFSDNGETQGFLAISGEGEIMGFAEAALRRDYVNGCETSPVLFLEGIYTSPDHRRRGVARLLTASVEAWGREAGCTEFASDAAIDNSDSHDMHAALGFEETQRVVYFRKAL